MLLKAWGILQNEYNNDSDNDNDNILVVIMIMIMTMTMTMTMAMGDSRKYPYPTTGGMSILTPPCPRKFQNAHPPLALRIPKSLTPPPQQNFPFLFQTHWNSCSTV